MFKKILILTSVLALVACNASFPRKNKATHSEKDSKVTFDFQNQTLTKEAKKLLDGEVLKVKNNSALKLAVEVNCDKSQSGSKKYNTGIANKRVAVIKDYLVKNGVNASKINTVVDGADKGSVKNFKSKNTCTITIAKK
jgi:outer membrane protein OmpA-like peptidoglycan-associated protein